MDSEEREEEMTICDRCGKETRSTTMSYFNEDIICPTCDKAEREHPAFEEARQAELEQVKAGNYNFRGVGKPHDL